SSIPHTEVQPHVDGFIRLPCQIWIGQLQLRHATVHHFTDGIVEPVLRLRIGVKSEDGNGAAGVQRIARLAYTYTQLQVTHKRGVSHKVFTADAPCRRYPRKEAELFVRGKFTVAVIAGGKRKDVFVLE